MNATVRDPLIGRLEIHLALTIVVAMLAVAIALSPSRASASISQAPADKHETPTSIARANAKAVLASEFVAWRQGQISTTQYESDRTAFVSQWGPATFASRSVYPFGGSGKFAAQPMSLIRDPNPSSYSLPLTEYPELSPSYCQSGYTCYCGPSTAESILQYLQPTSHDNEVLIQNGDYSPGQYGLAGIWGSNSPYSWKYLETNAPHGSTPGGETPWYSGLVNGQPDYPMPQSFNYWMSGNYTGYPYYAAYHPTSLSDYQGKLMADIGNSGRGWPLAADVDELAGGLHLPGHVQSYHIQHWIPLYGYVVNATYTDYIDPVAGSALNWNVSAYNPSYDSNNIYTLVTDGIGGIVW